MLEKIRKGCQNYIYYFNFYWGFYFYSAGYFTLKLNRYSKLFLRDNLEYRLA
ncbi:hypothetical protein SAMN05446037_102229 [Anaerovirgula multivorans]|uniref:Uncharacterized protein n=1 Tax=Anaerovirgula multivorans TaxID=312168 RepID=A0A239HJM8_9FIRM|nr:hypothetical protein SAMN05446037_102229 [Anaerovirgula multivorans]